MENIEDKGWLQKCGYIIYPLKRNLEDKQYWDCYIIEDDIKYYFKAKKFDIIKGTVSIYRIEESIFISSIYPQNSGDKCKILKKIENNKNEYEIEFLDYPYKTIAKKGLIKKGEVLNPQIEQIEFVDKIWPQNCGDLVKILRKIQEGRDKGKWEVEFIKYPYKKIAYKKAIELGNVFNPKVEESFINKIWYQNCGDYLKIIKKSSKKANDNSFFWECEFINHSYKTFAKKENIISGKVENKNIIWYSEEKLKQYIQENYVEKPTLKQLGEDLGISYSHIARRIKILNLTDFCSCGEYKQYELKNFLESFLDEKEIINEYWDKELQQEIDFYIPNLRLGIEFNGNYWHCNKFKEQNYHQNKTLNFKKKDIRLIHIWEWEFEENLEKIESYLKNICGDENLNKKIFARKCETKELKDIDYQNFCEENHLQGKVGARVKLGLFYEGNLVQIMSFGSPRFSDDFDWEIIRECSKLDIRVIGGKDKLWKYFVKKYNPNSVISYCDYSKFLGDSYLRLGFKFERLNRPGFKWWDNNSHKVYDRTPWKHQELKNFYKIWDCGQLVFTWNKENYEK